MKFGTVVLHTKRVVSAKFEVPDLHKKRFMIKYVKKKCAGKGALLPPLAHTIRMLPDSNKWPNHFIQTSNSAEKPFFNVFHY